jgi:hypothetical protein
MVRRLLALRLDMSMTEDYEFVRNHTLLVAHTIVFFCVSVSASRAVGQPQMFVALLKYVFMSPALHAATSSGSTYIQFL